MITVLILFLTFLSCFLGAYISYRISHGTLSAVYIWLFNPIHTVLWLSLLLYSKQNLISAAAWFDVVVALGYFVTFIYLGTPITITQIIGIFLLLIGLYLINW
jgi:hypothetical protein